MLIPSLFRLQICWVGWSGWIDMLPNLFVLHRQTFSHALLTQNANSTKTQPAPIDVNPPFLSSASTSTTTDCRLFFQTCITHDIGRITGHSPALRPTRSVPSVQEPRMRDGTWEGEFKVGTYMSINIDAPFLPYLHSKTYNFPFTPVFQLCWKSAAFVSSKVA